MFPLVSRSCRPQVTPGHENVYYDYQAWEDLALVLISYACLLKRDPLLINSWKAIEILLKHRYDWWKKWMFQRSDMVLRQFELKDANMAKFLSTVCICSDYIAGIGNIFGSELLTAIERAGWYVETKWIKKARSILTKVRAQHAPNSLVNTCWNLSTSTSF